MDDPLFDAHYLIGIPDCPGAPATIGLSRVYDTAADAEADLGVVMMLCRMTKGDTVVDSTSWYLQSAVTAAIVPTSSDLYYGYLLDDVVYPIAGGWADKDDAARWAPFVHEAEQRHAVAARMPWAPTMLKQFRLSSVAGAEQIDVDYFRFAPHTSRLLVRPLDLYVTEPLF